MRFLTISLLLLLIGCGGNVRTPDGPTGFVEVNGQQLPIPDNVDPTLMQQLATELESQLALRQHSDVPTQHQTPDLEVDGGDMWVWWEYDVNGDYDQNGEVNVADITPIAIDYQASEADADWDNHRMADGDGNGEVNLADISPIAINYSDTFGEYILESAPSAAGPWTEVGRYNLEFGERPPGGGLREYDIQVIGGAALVYQYIWTGTTGGGGNQAPVADLQADVTSGAPPLTVNLDASGSTDDVAVTGWAWDLDGDGTFDEADNGEDTFNGNANAQYTFDTAGTYHPAVRASDAGGLNNTASITITVGGGGGGDKMDLWTSGVNLRGINIWQAPFHEYYEDSGTTPVIPPYTNQEFLDLKAMGCNYVNISGPGLFSVNAPYVLDPDIQANLDQLLAWIEAADMFAVISARTGPGRSQFSIGGYEGIPPADVNDDVWSVPAARAGWVEMWIYMADRYKDNPIVLGYDMMCEPNSNVTMFPSPLWSPDEFYPGNAGSAVDWNPLAAEIIAGIRTVDQETPIVLSTLGMGQPEWLPYLDVISGDDRIVYAVHQYPPMDYTHPDDGPSQFEPDPPPPGWTPNDMAVTYPGTIDGRPFNQSTLFAEATWQEVIDFQNLHSLPVMSNEWGPQRYLVGAPQYFTDMAALFEQYGVNNAFWLYSTNYRTERGYPYNEWNFRYGTAFDSFTEVATSDMHSAIKNYWSLNTVFPSNWTGGGGNQAPVADLEADATGGAAPFTVNFDSAGSTDDVGITGREWDLDGDGIFGEVRNGEAGFADTATSSYTFEWAGDFQAKIRVRDGEGLTQTANVTINVSGAPPTRQQRFESINHFMYQIQELDVANAVDDLAATKYDLLVLEPTNTNVGQETFDAAGMVAQLKASPDSRGGNKLVIAYIDIGEAEDYRTYWDNGWTAPADRDTPGVPDWLVTIDPDGWSGNYPVAFWRSEWENLVINNPDSLLNNAIDSGFEGIYLDWVEGYDDEYIDAAALAEVPPVNAADAMVAFIGKIRTAARLRDPEFLVIQQNAPYLIDHATTEADWLAVVDGIAFEDTWFSGAGDGVWNDPGSGDTPNDGDGEYSTANRIIQSQRLTGLGVPVWTVDYCLPLPYKLAPPENFPQVYADSNSAGFIPLVTQVGLEKITTTPPPWD